MSLFKNIFKKKEPWVPFNLSFLGTDIHSHLIPAIDDGSKSMEDSLLLAKGLVDLGYKNAVTTPHIMSDYYRNTPEIISSGLTEINNAFEANQIPLGVKGAAEYYIDYEFITKVGKEKLLTFGDNYILVEFSFVEPPRAINEAFFVLQTNGYKPVLAHPERYSYWHLNPKELFELKDRDVLFQVNLLSLIGIYGEGSAKMGETLIENSMVEWLGTDLHNQHQLELLKKFKLKESFAHKVNGSKFLNQTL
jgi:tyrosine-protein phosphatase YwqE